MLTHLLLVTGAIRGEILGLKWDKVDFKKSILSIENNLLYSYDRGIYEDTLKTKESKRKIKIPIETTAILKEYRAWYLQEKLMRSFYYYRYIFSHS
jgi:integrase